MATWAIRAGYAAALLGRTWERAQAAILPTRHWRRLELGDLTLRLPPGWGDVEPAPDAGFVIHNRPRRFRVDGDAVWYSSAIELRIRQPNMEGVLPAGPMVETCRTIHASGGALVLALAVAKGVGPARRREAMRVLRNARRQRGAPIEWPIAAAQTAPGSASWQTATDVRNS